MHPRPLRVLIVCGDMPVPPAAVWVAGPKLFLDALLRASTHQNAAAELLKAHAGEIPLERLVVLDPEVILSFPAVMPTERDMIELYRSWSPVACMQAIRDQRVRALGGPEWLAPGRGLLSNCIRSSPCCRSSGNAACRNPSDSGWRESVC